MALILKVEGSFSADGLKMYAADVTGTYNASTNLGGWGAPNQATTTVTTFQIVCNWISAGSTVTYNFTVSSGTITVATMIDTAGTTFNIFSALTSTSFPFDTPDLFELTSVYGTAAKLPTLADGQFQLTYKAISASVPFTYTTSTTYFRDCDLKCCISTLRLTADVNCDCSDSVREQVNRAEYWWKSALCAVAVGKSNTVALEYFTKAQEVCENDCSGCN